MKVVFLAFLFVAVGASGLPQLQNFRDEYNTREQRIVTNKIIKAIEELAQLIKEVGLDPLVIDQFEFESTRFPPYFSVSIFIDSLRFTGLSNIAINRMDYSALSRRLRFDVSLPLLSLSLGNAGVQANIVGTEYTGQLSGSLAITQIRLMGDIRVDIGPISGISLRSVDVNFRVENIRSNLGLIVQDEDYSTQLNTILNEVIPKILEENQEWIDRYLSDLILEVGNLLVKRQAEGQVLIA